MSARREVIVAIAKHAEIVKQGAKACNQWRAAHPDAILRLKDADLCYANRQGADLAGADLRGANLRGANLTNANLAEAYLSGAELTKAILYGANLRKTYLSKMKLSWLDLRFSDLSWANLSKADLRGASLIVANLRGADLTDANLIGADLGGANLFGTKLGGANLSNATMTRTALSELDLSKVRGLDRVNHDGPSSLSLDTIVSSQNTLPEVFLRGCGLPEIFIEYIHSLTNQPIQYYSCFISYSTKDKEFAQRLHNDLQSEGVRCWFAPEDIQGGKKLHDQIDEAIRQYDKLLLILSPKSISSEWVKTEIAKARKREISQNRKMLFPVRLIDIETLKVWECFDADTGKDSAREIREYYIPDFSAWKKDHGSYSRELVKLLRDLKANSSGGA